MGDPRDARRLGRRLRRRAQGVGVRLGRRPRRHRARVPGRAGPRGPPRRGEEGRDPDLAPEPLVRRSASSPPTGRRPSRWGTRARRTMARNGRAGKQRAARPSASSRRPEQNRPPRPRHDEGRRDEARPGECRSSTFGLVPEEFRRGVPGQARRAARRPRRRVAYQGHEEGSSRASTAGAPSTTSSTPFEPGADRRRLGSARSTARAPLEDGPPTSAVKVQYPGRSRKAVPPRTCRTLGIILWPHEERPRPGLDPKAMGDEIRFAHRRGARLRAGGPRTSAASPASYRGATRFITVPEGRHHPRCSHEKVIVHRVRQRPRASRSSSSCPQEEREPALGEIIFRFYFSAACYRPPAVLRRPASPATRCCSTTGRMAFLGLRPLFKRIPPEIRGSSSSRSRPPWASWADGRVRSSSTWQAGGFHLQARALHRRRGSSNQVHDMTWWYGVDGRRRRADARDRDPRS